MRHSSITRLLAVLLALSLLIIGGIASAQSITHHTQHAHHQKSNHGTVLCSWMCAAGQVLDAATTPYLVERSPVALTEPHIVQIISSLFSPPFTSRGPPATPRSNVI